MSIFHSMVILLDASILWPSLNKKIYELSKNIAKLGPWIISDPVMPKWSTKALEPNQTAMIVELHRDTIKDTEMAKNSYVDRTEAREMLRA